MAILAMGHRERDVRSQGRPMRRWFRGKEPSWGWENARNVDVTIGRLCVFNNMVAFILILASGMAILAMVQQGETPLPRPTDSLFSTI